MTRHRRSRRALRIVLLIAGPLVSAGFVGRAALLGTDPPAGPTASIGADGARLIPGPLAVRPTGRASPQYLTQSYRAPPALVHPGRGGRLEIPSLGVLAPVDAVGLDDTAMAVPDDPARVGWLTVTAGDRDLVGASVLAGHVSDLHDRPGALARLDRITVGADILWTDRNGRERTYRVTSIRRYPRSTGLPAELFRTDGAHVLHLITCADRHPTPNGGFHYAANLVVTARTQQTGHSSTD